MDNSTPIYLVRAMCRTKDRQIFAYKQRYLPVRQDFIQPIQYFIYPHGINVSLEISKPTTPEKEV